MPTNDRNTAKFDLRAKKARAAREEAVVAKAARLDPDDQSDWAQQIRETAADIQDHRDNPAGR